MVHIISVGLIVVENTVVWLMQIFGTFNVIVTIHVLNFVSHEVRRLLERHIAVRSRNLFGIDLALFIWVCSILANRNAFEVIFLARIN
jgi:hypothetical protein